MSLLLRLLMVVGACACFGCQPVLEQPAVTYSMSPTSNSPVLVAAAQAVPESPTFVGRNSCSATACHGQPQPKPFSWRNAYTLWEAADPHRRAFDVLYTERSVTMFRKLTEHDAETIDDAAYLLFLEKRCIGCHATPPTGAESGKLTRQASADAYWQGVSCESCHGPASHWLGTHYAQSWPGSTDPARVSLHEKTGFQDTRLLNTRAATCLKCHHGPQQLGTEVYDVNHDLIAAGHPRLQFELHAYLANLPKHWDETLEIKRYAENTPAEPSAFHFNTWRAGQEQQAKQETSLQAERKSLAERNQVGAWAEFANQDCRHCHHTYGQTAFRMDRAGQTRAVGAGLFQNLSASPSLTERAQVLSQLMEAQRLRLDTDRAVEIYLATAAFSHDLPDGTLTSELTQLQQVLTAQAGKSQYDLPARVDHRQLQPALSELKTALEKLAQ